MISKLLQVILSITILLILLFIAFMVYNYERNDILNEKINEGSSAQSVDIFFKISGNNLNENRSKSNLKENNFISKKSFNTLSNLF